MQVKHCIFFKSGLTSEFFLTLFQTTNFRLFQTKSLLTTVSNLVKNSRKLSKEVENTVFSEDFQKTADTRKPGLVWERVKQELGRPTIPLLKLTQNFIAVSVQVLPLP